MFHIVIYMSNKSLICHAIPYFQIHQTFKEYLMGGIVGRMEGFSEYNGTLVIS